MTDFVAPPGGPPEGAHEIVPPALTVTSQPRAVEGAQDRLDPAMPTVRSGPPASAVTCMATVLPDMARTGRRVAAR